MRDNGVAREPETAAGWSLGVGYPIGPKHLFWLRFGDSTSVLVSELRRSVGGGDGKFEAGEVRLGWAEGRSDTVGRSEELDTGQLARPCPELVSGWRSGGLECP